MAYYREAQAARKRRKIAELVLTLKDPERSAEREEASKKLVRAFGWKIKSLGGKYYDPAFPGSSREDVVQLAKTGLLEAVDVCTEEKVGAFQKLAGTIMERKVIDDLFGQKGRCNYRRYRRLEETFKALVEEKGRLPRLTELAESFGSSPENLRRNWPREPRAVKRLDGSSDENNLELLQKLKTKEGLPEERLETQATEQEERNLRGERKKALEELGKRFTGIQSKVYPHFLNLTPTKEIAEATGLTMKQADQALTRIKRSLGMLPLKSKSKKEAAIIRGLHSWWLTIDEKRRLMAILEHHIVGGKPLKEVAGKFDIRTVTPHFLPHRF